MFPKALRAIKDDAEPPKPPLGLGSRSLSGIDFVVREINKLRTEVRLQVIDSSSKICSLRHPPRSGMTANTPNAT